MTKRIATARCHTAELPVPACECVRQINPTIERLNGRVACVGALRCDDGPVIVFVRVLDNSRARAEPLMARCCPFCGELYTKPGDPVLSILERGLMEAIDGEGSVDDALGRLTRLGLIEWLHDEHGEPVGSRLTKVGERFV